MKKILLTILMWLCPISFFITDIEAKRFGGGRSFGISRQSSGRSATGQKQSSWFDTMAKIALGALLATLIMKHGVSWALLLWIAIGLAIYFAWRWYIYKQRLLQRSHINTKDEIDFLQHAKAFFLRMQEANDNSDLAYIREFTTPHVFNEIQRQIDERGNQINHTEIVSLDAQLLDLNLDSQPKFASVLFTGFIREDFREEAIRLNEIWHFQNDNEHWVVAGVQQLN